MPTPRERRMRKKRRIRERCRNCRRKFRADRHTSGPARSCSKECREVLTILKDALDRLKAPKENAWAPSFRRMAQHTLTHGPGTVITTGTIRVKVDAAGNLVRASS